MTSNPSLEQIKASFHVFEGKRHVAVETLDLLTTMIEKLDKRSLNIAKASALASVIAKQTQEELCIQLTSLVTLALKAVFPDPYKFVLRFEEKRGKTEALLLVERNGMEVDPYDAAGGGVVDVISFALRICMWKLAEKPSRNTLVLDEPYRFVSRDLQAKIGGMLRDISNKLGLQMIIVTHEEELMGYGDAIYICKRRDRISEIVRDDQSEGLEKEKDEVLQE